MKVITNETQHKKKVDILLTISKIFFIIFILIMVLSTFTWWYTMRGKIDKHISSEDLESINSTFYTNFRDSSNIVEQFCQWHMQGGTCYDIYIKNIGNYQEFLDNYTTISNKEIFTDENVISDSVQRFLQFYFNYNKNFDVEGFIPSTLVEAKVGNYDNGIDKNIRFYFFTENDNSQSVIIDVIYGH